MPVYTQSWSPVTDGLLSFTNIWVNEIDIGFTNPFVNTASQPQAIDGPVTGIIWGGFGALTYGAGSSQTLTFNYDVTSNSATDLIYSFNSLYAVDVFFGAGANLVATANIYDSGGGLIASQTYTAGGPLPNAVSFVQAQQSVHVTLTISEYIDAGDTGFSAVDLSAIMQIFDTMPTDQLCSIGDYVWLDLDGDGLQTAPSADPGIGGVVVQLLDADDLSVLAITTTNENGFYLFDNLLAGTYIVKFVTPDGFVFSPQGVGSNETIDSDADTATGMTGPITLEAGDHVRSVDAGLTIGGSGAGSTASLGDYVWIDANGNGIQDTGEAGLAGVTVNLLNDTGSVILATTTTNSLGQYAFTNLAAGTYVVQFVRPDGYVFTSAAQGLNNAVDSDADVGTGLTGPITLTAGQVNATIDAGLIYCAPATASIGNYVWFDCNGNGKQDSGESGIGGVTVQLMNATGTTVLATTVTNSSGFYQFTGLAAGTYQVYFGTKSGYQLTAARQGTDITKDSNPDPTTRLSGPITLSAGQYNDTIDAGMVQVCAPTSPKATIGNFVWNDANKNGIQDAGEGGISGVTVKLMDATGTTVLATTTTDYAGYYSFTNLAAGTYQVYFGAKSGYVLTGADKGSDDAKDSDANQTSRLSGPITVTAGEVNNTVDAGMYYYCAPTGAIGDRVWNDANKNGIQDYGEVGIKGVTVKLMDATGTKVLATTTTDSNGNYLFSGLSAGTYQVYFGGVANYVLTGADKGSDDSKDSDANTISRLSGPITLTEGQVNKTVDAGMYYYCAPSAVIGDRVWNDVNKNGIQDSGEAGIAGVTVQLMNSTATTVLQTTVTDSNGYYQFTGLAAGTYQVYFGTKSGWVLTGADKGYDDTKDSDASISTRLSGPITLTDGQVNKTVDAGMYQSDPCNAQIGDRVWNDANKNGVQDYGESGISGVTVKLMDAAGTTVLATTTTDSSGYYKFTGLAAGTYQVYFGTKSGWVLTGADKGYDDTKDSDANTATRLSGPITITAGQINNTVDAGMYLSSGGGICDPDRVGGLSAGFWSTHLKAWDGAYDTTYSNLVCAGTLSSLDVLRSLPNQGKSGPGGTVGVLLGDTNGNGVTDSGEITLFVGLTAAQKIISSSDSANDARQILMKQAIAAQLNIYNGNAAPGAMTVGADLISKAVQWLRGQGSFIYSDGSSGSVDKYGTAGVLDSGTSGAIDFNTSTGAFTSSALSSSKYAWTQDKSLGISDFMASGQDLKNALQAFNEDKLITSSDGTLVGWNSGGLLTEAQTNNAAGVYAILRSHGII